MKNRLIGISGFSFTREQMEELHTLAKELGLSLREIPHGSLDPAHYADCEALAGDYELAALDLAADLHWFHSDWAGVETLVPLPAFRERGAVLTNSAGAYGVMVAEYILMACLALLRHMPAYLDAQRQQQWREPLPAESICGKRVTVLGVGSNGSCFARMASALGARVSGVDARMSDKPAWLAALYPIDRLHEALRETDILAMCLPLTAETQGIIGEAELSLLPAGALIVNTGRGPTLDEGALVEALNSGRLGGAALDVFTEEPVPAGNPLWSARNLIVTPHVSGLTADRLNTERVFEIFRDNLGRWGKGEPLQNVVDVRKGY